MLLYEWKIKARKKNIAALTCISITIIWKEHIRNGGGAGKLPLSGMGTWERESGLGQIFHCVLEMTTSWCSNHMNSLLFKIKGNTFLNFKKHFSVCNLLKQLFHCSEFIPWKYSKKCIKTCAFRVHFSVYIWEKHPGHPSRGEEDLAFAVMEQCEMLAPEKMTPAD